MILEAKGGAIELSTETIAALQLRWTTRDVASELAKMHLWLLRYPKRRPASIWRFVDNWLKAAPAVRKPSIVVNAWWSTEERTLNQGAAIGCNPRPGESMAQFRERLGDVMRKSA